MATNVAWSDDGTILLAIASGTLRVHDAATLAVRATLEDVVAARCPLRQVIALHGNTELGRYDLDGDTLDSRKLFVNSLAHAAWMARDGHRALVRDYHTVYVCAASGDRLWELAGWRHDLRDARVFDAAISDDGKLVAIATVTPRTKPLLRGQVWLVIDVGTGELVGRGFIPIGEDTQPVRVALDAAGRRLAIAARELGGAAEVISLAKRPTGPAPWLRPRGPYAPEPEPTRTGALVTAVALDPRGAIACYAVAPRQLRIDYLDRAGAIGEQRWLDAELPDVTALALAPDGHSIAAVASDGTLGVVMVP